MNPSDKSLALAIWALASASLLWTQPARAAEEGMFTIAGGAEYTTGEYGGEKSIDEIYVPVTAYYDTNAYSLRLTVPFLRVRAPLGTVTEGPGGEIIVGEGPTETESGLGDVIASATVYNVFTSAGGDAALDLTGKIKFGTADEDKGLGTGETDYSMQVDMYRFFERFTAIGAVGYTFRGDPDGVDLDNSAYFSVGGSYRLSATTRVSAFYDFRQASLSQNDDPQEISVMVSQRLDPAWVVRGYALAGLTDSSPDFGAGVAVSKGF